MAAGRRCFEMLYSITRGVCQILSKRTLSNASFCRTLTTSRLGGENALKTNKLNEYEENYEAVSESPLKLPSAVFVNKNPRNPEYFGYNKQRGYSTQYKKRNFYKRLNLILSNRYVKAYVEDQKGNILVSASTEEFEITKHLYKPNDVTAALNIGHIMAERCLQAGLNRVSMFTTDIRKKEKYKEFRKALVKGGVQLTEPAGVVPQQTFYTGISVRKRRKGIIGQKMNNSTKRKFT